MYYNEQITENKQIFFLTMPQPCSIQQHGGLYSKGIDLKDHLYDKQTLWLCKWVALNV